MRGIDAHGRAKFYFCSFAKPVIAFRTLWKNRKLSPEQRLELVDNAEKKYPENEKHLDDTDTFTGMEEASMSHICSFDIPLTTDCVMTLFDKGPLEEVVAEKMGYIDYVSASWDRLDGQPGVQRRQISQFGSKVSCIQQKTISDNLESCVLDDVLTLHDVPFGDHFQVQMRREIETISTEPPLSSVNALWEWHGT